ncbi:MAG: VCBS repeat-containing protein [Clostridia bacterium]|nr:VCBS repeat-containing protein [Clostridia bacterium]
MKKRSFLILILILSLLLTGCSLGGEVGNLLTPPTMSVGREALTKAIKSAIGENYELVYPQAGSYRTGIVSVDLTGDGMAEAVCFYKAGGKLQFLVMQQIGEEWHRLAKGESEAASVGRVAFGDLNGDGVSEIVVGWQYLTDTDGSYDIYAIRDGKASSIHAGLYTRFVMMESEPDKLFVMSRNSSTKSVTASLVGLKDGAIGLVNTVAMYGRASDYLAITSAKTAGGLDAVYVDGLLENGQVLTEVLAVNEQGELANELLTQLEVSTLRYTTITCRDVNKDDIPEIPIEEALPAYLRNGVEENLYLIHWNTFDGKSLSPVSHSFVDMTEQFSLDYPEDWYGKVTVERPETGNRSFAFKTMEGELLFTIRVYGISEYSDKLAGTGWRRLYEDSDHVYTVFCENGNSMEINYQRVYGLFNVIN